MDIPGMASTVAATAAATLTTGLVTAATYSTDVPAATSTAPDSSPGRGGHHRPTDSRRGVIIGVISFILPLTTAVVLLRFYTRHYLSRAVGADDWMMLLSLVLAIVDGTTMLLMTTQGLGHHMWTLTSAQVETYNMYFYLSIVFYYSCLGTVKTAILLQYLRVFAVKMRKITIVALVLIGLWSSALVLVSVLACRPIRGFWDKTVPASCVPDLPQWYVNAAGNIATDVIIFTLPIPVLWHLNLPRSQRLSLIGIFGLGFFTCTISVIRITFLNLNGDDTYSNVAAACWSIGELCCAIVCSCLPTLRPVFFHFLPGTLRNNYRHNNYDGNINPGSNHPHQRSSGNRQSAYLNANGGFGSPDTDTIGSEGYRLKSVRSGGTARGSPLPNLHDDMDAETMIRRGSRTTFASKSNKNGGGDGDDKDNASYYNLFYHQFHPHNTTTTTTDTPSSNKVGLSFTTTSRLRSDSSSSENDRDGDRDHSARNSSDGDSDLERFMQWAGRDFERQKYRRDPEKRAIVAAAAATAAAAPPTATATAAAATTTMSAFVASPARQSLPTTPSRRSLRGMVTELAGPLASSGRSSSPRGGGTRYSISSSTETLARAAQAGGRTSNGGGGSSAAAAARREKAAGATFFLSDDEDGKSDSNNNSSKGAAAAAAVGAAAGKRGRRVGKAASITSPLSSPQSSASSSAAPTRAHSPSPSPSPSPTPPRSYSYSHLRRMAAAVGAGIGVGGGSGSGSGGHERRDASSGGPSVALAAPVISPITPLTPGDPLAMDRDAYLGLRQGTITSIEANRPSTAEAEAIGWELPTGPGIQIRREVAQNVGPA